MTHLDDLNEWIRGDVLLDGDKKAQLEAKAPQKDAEFEAEFLPQFEEAIKAQDAEFEEGKSLEEAPLRGIFEKYQSDEVLEKANVLSLDRPIVLKKADGPKARPKVLKLPSEMEKDAQAKIP